MSEETGPVVNIDRDLEDLIPEYLENRRKDIIEIRKLLTLNDFDTIKRLSHNIKGSGGSFGFQRISEIGITMEQAAKDCVQAEILKSLSELELYVNSVKIVYTD